MQCKKLTDKRISEILERAEICDGSVLTDYADIAAAMREIQEYRKASADAEPVMYVMVAGENFDTEATSTSKAVVDSWVEEWNESGEHVYRTVPLYTAPPPTPDYRGITQKDGSMSDNTKALNYDPGNPFPVEIECDICGHLSTDPEGRHFCSEDSSDDGYAVRIGN